MRSTDIPEGRVTCANVLAAGWDYVVRVLRLRIRGDREDDGRLRGPSSNSQETLCVYVDCRGVH